MSQVETQAPAAPKAPLRLTLARTTAAEEIQNQLKIGQAIRDQRVRDQRDLDEARLEKQERELEAANKRLAELEKKPTATESVAGDAPKTEGEVSIDDAEYAKFKAMAEKDRAE